MTILHNAYPRALLITLILIFSSVITPKVLAQYDTIMVLGDSISAAYGMDKKQGWVSLLEEQLIHNNYHHYTVVNASISGNTTGDGLNRLPLLLKTHKPGVVIIELGGNDGLRGYPLGIMKKNLVQLIELAKHNGAKVLLAGIEIPPNYGQRYTDAFRNTYQQVANNQKVAFLPFILEDIATQPTLMQADGIHPTADAQPLILRHVWPYLHPLLKKSSTYANK